MTALLQHQRTALRGMAATFLILLALATVFVLCAGCSSVSGLREKIEAALPHVDGDLAVDVSTVYGAAGSLREKNVKWDGDKRTVTESELRITLPAGTYVRRITKPVAP